MVPISDSAHERPVKRDQRSRVTAPPIGFEDDGEEWWLPGYEPPSDKASRIEAQPLKHEAAPLFFRVEVHLFKQEVTSVLGMKLSPPGVVVDKIFEGYPATAAAVSVGDIIHTINGVDVTTPSQAARTLDALTGKIHVSLTRKSAPSELHGAVSRGAMARVPIELSPRPSLNSFSSTASTFSPSSLASPRKQQRLAAVAGGEPDSPQRACRATAASTLNSAAGKPAPVTCKGEKALGPARPFELTSYVPPALPRLLEMGFSRLDVLRAIEEQNGSGRAALETLLAGRQTQQEPAHADAQADASPAPQLLAPSRTGLSFNVGELELGASEAPAAGDAESAAGDEAGEASRAARLAARDSALDASAVTAPTPIMAQHAWLWQEVERAEEESDEEASAETGRGIEPAAAAVGARDGPITFEVTCNGVRMGSTFNEKKWREKRWLAKPIKEVIVAPFLQAYNKSSAPRSGKKLALEDICEQVEVAGSFYAWTTPAAALPCAGGAVTMRLHTFGA